MSSSTADPGVDATWKSKAEHSALASSRPLPFQNDDSQDRLRTGGGSYIRLAWITAEQRLMMPALVFFVVADGFFTYGLILLLLQWVPLLSLVVAFLPLLRLDPRTGLLSDATGVRPRCG